MRSVFCWLMAAVLAGPGAVDVADAERELQLGIRQVNGGELDAAVLTLDRVIQKLEPQAAGRAQELAQAHLYKGVALVGLLQEEPAKASFREALRHHPALRLEKGQFPDRVLRVFEAARKGEAGSVMKRPSGAPKKAGIGAGVILGIAGGVLVAGSVAATQVGGGNRPPADVSITVSPSGPALLGATVLTFSASARDPNGDALHFNWSFPDARVEGQTVTHVFNVEGAQTVGLSVTDGAGGSASAITSITSRGLGGCWKEANGTVLLFITVHSQAQFAGSFSESCAPGTTIVEGALGNPRAITRLTVTPASGPALSYVGQVDSALDVITLTCTSSSCPPPLATYTFNRIG